jgi:hypothetical protein
MEAVALSSPSALLKSPKIKPTPTVNRNGGTKKKAATAVTAKAIVPAAAGVVKPKQSKSRNGVCTNLDCLQNLETSILTLP